MMIRQEASKGKDVIVKGSSLNPVPKLELGCRILYQTSFIFVWILLGGWMK